MVHKGFFAGAKAVMRRIKELIVAACMLTHADVC
jgi:hypothetical protein